MTQTSYNSLFRDTPTGDSTIGFSAGFRRYDQGDDMRDYKMNILEKR